MQSTQFQLVNHTMGWVFVRFLWQFAALFLDVSLRRHLAWHTKHISQENSEFAVFRLYRTLLRLYLRFQHLLEFFATFYNFFFWLLFIFLIFFLFFKFFFSSQKICDKSCAKRNHDRSLKRTLLDSPISALAHFSMGRK